MIATYVYVAIVVAIVVAAVASQLTDDLLRSKQLIKRDSRVLGVLNTSSTVMCRLVACHSWTIDVGTMASWTMISADSASQK